MEAERGPGSTECDDKEGIFEGGLGGKMQSTMGDAAPHVPSLLFFFTFILTRGCFCEVAQGSDRRHQLPVRLLN